MSKAAFYDILSEFYGYRDDYIVAQGLGSGASLLSTYYDGELGAYKLADYFGTTANYYDYADNLNTAYAVNYGRVYSWGVPGYWAFGEGLAERYIRRADASALSDLDDLCASAAYHVSGSLPVSNVDRHELSREWSYCVLNLIQLSRCQSLTAGQISRRDACYADLLTILDDWAVGQTASYYRPFMGAILAHALISYYDHVASAGQKTTIQSALATLATHTWDTCWDEAGQALLYTDRIGVNPPDAWASSEDGNPAPDLSMLIAPWYAWLWMKTSDTAWRTKAESIFNGGLPIYSGSFWSSGAYLGTRSASNPNGKHINQQLVWGSKYFDYIETGVSASEPASGRTWGWRWWGAAADVTPAFDASQYGTVIAEYDFTDSTLVLNGSATSATNGQTVATVNAKSGAGTLTQSTDSKRPLLATAALNGQQVITFDGTDDWFTAPADWAKNRGFIVVAAVFKMTDAGGHALVQTNAASTVNLLTWINGTNFSFVAEGKRSGGAGFQRFGSLGSQDTWYGGVWTYDFAGNSCRIDTANGNMLAAGAQDGAGATANSDANGSETNTVGAGNIYGSNAFKGQLAHLIFYSAQTSQQRADLLTALEAKHGALA